MEFVLSHPNYFYRKQHRVVGFWGAVGIFLLLFLASPMAWAQSSSSQLSDPRIASAVRSLASIGQPTFHQTVPAIAANGTNQLVVWMEERGNQTYDIMG